LSNEEFGVRSGFGAVRVSQEPRLTSAVESNETLAVPADRLGAVLARLRAAARAHVPSYDERIDALDALGRAILARTDSIAEAISRDFGNRSRHESFMGDVFPVLGAIQHAKVHLRDWMEPEDRATNWINLPSRCEVLHQPLGVVGIIAPWNYPVQLALSPLVAALAAGNRAMIKPSELSPRTSDLLGDVVAEAFDADRVTVVTGDGQVGEAFASLPFDHLVFTGSTRVGKLVMQAASENLVPVTLELGGKSPAIVGADFDVRGAAARIMAGKTFSAGQSCIAPDYALVPDASRPAFVAACRAAVARMYPTLENNPDYTAIVDDRHHARVRRTVEDARARGAEVVEINPAGEPLDPAKRKFAPTLIVDPTEEMLCLKEEIFGPVLPIVAYRHLDDAIEYVNARPRPLALYYFGHDRSAIDRVLTETTSGGVSINETMLHILQNDLPYGGIGPSGMGQYHGRAGFDALTHAKPVFHQSRIHTRRLLSPPYGKMADRLLRLLLGR
jgi:coniferyl-aldehyde dehydrogenase